MAPSEDEFDTPALDTGLKEQCSWMWLEGFGLCLFKGKMFHYPKQDIMINVIGRKLWLGDVFGLKQHDSISS